IKYLVNTKNKYLYTFIIGSVIYIIIHYLLFLYPINFLQNSNLFYYIMGLDFVAAMTLLYFKSHNVEQSKNNKNKTITLIKKKDNKENKNNKKELDDDDISIKITILTDDKINKEE